MNGPKQPRERFVLLLTIVQALAASTLGLVPWWAVLREFHGLAPSLVLARRAGDIQYFPLISGLAQMNFGENLVFEEHGRGVASIPFATILPHAICVRVFGVYGWVVADMIVAVGYFYAGRWLLREVGLSRLWAAVFSLGLLVASFSDATSLLYTPTTTVQLFPSPSSTGAETPFRIPRAYVTELVVLVALAALLRFVHAAKPDPRAKPWSNALIVAFAVAGLVQADVYATFAIAPMSFLLVGARIATDLSRAERRRYVIASALVILAALPVLTAPFLVQRLLENPDIPVRFGVVKVPRWSDTLSSQETADLQLALVSALAVFLPLVSGGLLGRREFRRSLSSIGCLFLVAAGSAISRALFIRVTGSMVQEYHFPWQPLRSYGVAATCLVACTAYHALRAIGARTASLGGLGRRSSAMLELGAGVICTFAAVLFVVRFARAESRMPLRATHVRSDFPEYADLGDAYFDDFRQLTGELSRCFRDRGVRVLATLDHQVMVYWVAMQHGSVLNPDPFSTTLGDAEIEKRLVAFGRLTNLDATSFIRLITQDNYPDKNESPNHNTVVNNLFLSHHKYGGRSQWQLAIPTTELERLERLYDESSDAGRYRVDGVVAFSRGRLAHVQPDAARFEKVFENSTFQLYLARASTPTAAP